MSVYKRPGSIEYSYDFKFRGRRFSGPTFCTARREAERFEAEIREKARQRHKNRLFGDDRAVTVAAAFERYYDEVGQYSKRPNELNRDLKWLAVELGLDTTIDQITTSTIAGLMAKRRAHEAWNRGKLLSSASVNRYVLERLRAVLKRAHEVWEIPVRPINWKMLRLSEPRERIREMSADEENALLKCLAPKYQAIMRFAVLSGFRKSEILNLMWKDIDWRKARIHVVGKGDKPAFIPLSNSLRSFLNGLPRTSLHVFPVGDDALKSAWRRAIAKAEIKDLRFHDLRHTCASRFYRATKDLEATRRLLRHEDIATTTRYAHVTQDDLQRQMDAAFPAQNAGS